MGTISLPGPVFNTTFSGGVFPSSVLPLPEQATRRISGAVDVEQFCPSMTRPSQPLRDMGAGMLTALEFENFRVFGERTGRWAALRRAKRAVETRFH